MKRVLTGVALLGAEIPAVKNLDEFMAFYNDNSDARIYIYQEVKSKQEEDMEKEMEKKYQDEIASKDAEIKKLSDAKAEVEKKYADITMAQKDAEVKLFVDKGITEGKILPAHKDAVVFILSNCNDSIVKKYKEGDVEKEKSMSTIVKEYIDSLPKLVEFTEKSNANDKKEDDLLDGFVAKDETEFGTVNSQKLDYATKKFMENNKEKVKEYKDALVIVAKKYPDLI